jgi:hypothetical protein
MDTILGQDEVKDLLKVACEDDLPVLLVGETGCFAKGTLVLMKDGYTPIETIKINDLVATFDGNSVSYNSVEFTQVTSDKPKPMIQFKYGEETITATYDHPFYNGTKYYPLYQLVWGEMETSARVQLKLLCQHYGQAFNDKTIRGITHSDTQTWERCFGASSNSNEWENDQSTSNNSANMATQSRQLAGDKSQRLQSSKQYNNKSGMVYPQTQLSTRLQDGKNYQINTKSPESKNQVQQSINPRDPKLVGHKYTFGSSKRQNNQAATINCIAEKISLNSEGNTKIYTTKTKHISSVVVKQAEPYYALGVANVHTYIVSKEQLPVHNTGKTSLVRELASMFKKPYTRFSITGETTVDDFVGKYILKKGETVWQDGILLTAIKQGHYLVVDEVNAALPEILFVLHSLLDDDKYVIVPQKDNSIVKPHKDFRFFATMNPVDEYAGTKDLNKAFQSRFAMVLNVEYPSRDVEVDILIERTLTDRSVAQKMVDVAIGMRRAKNEDKIFYTFSTRDLLYWGKLHTRIGLHPAFNVTVRNKGSSDDTEVIEKIYTQVFSDYQKAESVGVQTNIEWYREEHAKLEKVKKDVRPQVEKEVRAELKEELDKVNAEKTILTDMETRLKEEIKKGLKA